MSVVPPTDGHYVSLGVSLVEPTRDGEQNPPKRSLACSARPVVASCPEGACQYTDCAFRFDTPSWYQSAIAASSISRRTFDPVGSLCCHEPVSTSGRWEGRHGHGPVGSGTCPLLWRGAPAFSQLAGAHDLILLPGGAGNPTHVCTWGGFKALLSVHMLRRPARSGWRVRGSAVLEGPLDLNDCLQAERDFRATARPE